MADGSAVKQINPSDTSCFTPEEAIGLLEAGDWSDSWTVQLESGALVSAGDTTSPTAFLQRLRGHVRLISLATNEAGAVPGGIVRTLHVRADVKALLDVVKRAR